MEASVLLGLLLIAADITLWVLSIVMPLGETNRFRLQAGATLLLAILGGNFFGWGLTISYGALGLWAAAIFKGFIGRTA